MGSLVMEPPGSWAYRNEKDLFSQTHVLPESKRKVHGFVNNSVWYNNCVDKKSLLLRGHLVWTRFVPKAGTFKFLSVLAKESPSWSITLESVDA